MDYKYKFTHYIDRPTIIAFFEIDEVVPAAVLFFILLILGHMLLALFALFGLVAIAKGLKKIFPVGWLKICLYMLLPFYKLSGSPEYYKKEMHG